MGAKKHFFLGAWLRLRCDCSQFYIGMTSYSLQERVTALGFFFQVRVDLGDTLGRSIVCPMGLGEKGSDSFS